MSTVTVYTTLTQRTCPDCGGVYAIAKEYLDEANRLGHFKKCWTCPYCKTERGYGESEIDRLQKQLEAERERRQREEQLRRDAQRERDHHWTERKKLSTRHAHLRQRVKHGVCPCCHRTFKQLAEHMKAKHPHYAGKGAEES
jgi:hypothetical protein